MTNLARFRSFIQAFTRLIEMEGGDEQQIFVSGKPLLEDLVSNDDWLPSDFSRSDPRRLSENKKPTAETPFWPDFPSIFVK